MEFLNFVQVPVWFYSCQQQRLVWGNDAALAFFNRPSQASFTTFDFSSCGDVASFKNFNQLLLREVELGGAEHVISGFGHKLLPGVIPHDQSHSCVFLFKQVSMDSRSSGGKEVCTCVQLIKGPQHNYQLGSAVIPQANNVHVKTTKSMNGPKADIEVTTLSLVEVCESILQGAPVDLDVVDALHMSALRGDVVITGSRLEDLAAKEELDQDVGLNLLQLLGDSKLSGNEDWSSMPRAEDAEREDDRPRRRSGALQSMQFTASFKSLSLSPGGKEDAVRELAVPLGIIPAMEAVLGTVEDWRFNAFKLAEVTQGHPLSALAFWLITKGGVAAQWQMDTCKLARFLRRMEDGYPDNPYHNKSHAADVLQGVHCIMTRGGVLRRIHDDIVVLAAYLAAVMHDYEHRGLNNDFLVRSGDDLAVIYNDTAPMENHHVASAFKVLQQREFNFMANMPRDKYLRLRRLLIEMVLATDMKQHFSILSKLQSKLHVKLRPGASTDAVHTMDVPPPIEDDADKSLVLQVALKCADVGHLAAPWDVHTRWVSGLEEEFFRQGDREKAHQMAVSPLMDRCKDGITKSQVGFFDIVALPLFQSLAAMFPDAGPLVRAVEDNCGRWRALDHARNSTMHSSSSSSGGLRNSK